MALGPLGPGPERKDDLRVEGRLMDRAHFLGTAASQSRTKAQEPTGQDATTFQKALKKKLDPREADESEETSEAQPEAQPDASAAGEQPGGELKDPLAQERSTELEIRLQGQEEGEKLGAGAGAWRGPNPLFGLALVTAPTPLLAGAVTPGEGSRSERESERVQEVGVTEARVDAGLLHSLEEAGLKRPLTGLDDPRLAGTRPALEAEDGWRSGPVPGGVGYTWEGPGRAAYQRLEWSDVRTLLESAAGTTLHTLERKGGQLFARLKKRTPPSPTSFKVDE